MSMPRHPTFLVRHFARTHASIPRPKVDISLFLRARFSDSQFPNSRQVLAYLDLLAVLQTLRKTP